MPMAQPNAARLSLLHRCAILYLTAPVLIWLVSWFEWWFGLPAALFLGLALVPVLRGGWRPRQPSRAALAIVALGLGWTMLTAHGNVFDGNNSDWWDRRAMLLDLSRHPWPVYLRDGLADYLPWGGGERQALLRYYLAWYIVPGLAGRLFGPAALHWAVPLWSGLGITLVLLLFARGLPGWRTVLAAGMFVLFGGMDTLRMLLLRGPEWFQFGIDGLGWPGVHVNFTEIFEFRDLRWTVYLSNFENFRYSPDILAAALYALLILHLRHHRLFVAASGVLLATAVFWSPFVAIGLLPFAAILICENALRRPAALAGWSNLCVAVPLAGLFVVYLSSGALDFGSGWLWEGYGWRRFAKWARRFYLSEFLVLLLFLLMLRPRLAREPFFAAMSAMLLLLPLYRLGDLNLTMRGALPSLVFLCWFCSRGLLMPVGRTAIGSPKLVRGVGFAGVVACLAIGATGPLLQIASATRDDVSFRYALSGFTTFSQGVKRENLAPEVSPALAKIMPARVVEESSAADYPVIRTDFHIHVRDGQIIFVNEHCDYNDHVIRVRFVPANPDTNARLDWNTWPRRYGAGCGAMVSLPGLVVHSARVGQTPPDGGDWAVEILLDEAGDAAGLSHPPACSFHYGEAGRSCPVNAGITALRDAYDRVSSAAPAARSRFNVYLDDEWLTYVREPCAFGDIEARFFLHLVPENLADLPLLPLGEVADFDNRDFAFGEHGALFDGKCVAAWRLPYAVRELTTGQFTAAKRMWSATINRRVDGADGTARTPVQGVPAQRVRHVAGIPATMTDGAL